MKVDKFIFLADFVIVDLEKESNIPIIVGMSFIAIGKTLIDVAFDELMLKVDNEEGVFNVFNVMQYREQAHNCFCVNAIHSRSSAMLKESIPLTL